MSELPSNDFNCIFRDHDLPLIDYFEQVREPTNEWPTCSELKEEDFMILSSFNMDSEMQRPQEESLKKLIEDELPMADSLQVP